MSDDPRTPRALYDASASHWVRHEPTSLSDFTARPAVLAMCGAVDGKRVLDVGCGEGYCSRALRRSRAAEVVGVDVSEQMIRAAQSEEVRATLGIEYFVDDATTLAHVVGDFDVVLAMFMFNYLTLDETKRSMAAVHRVLRPGGLFVFAVPHPSLPFLRAHEPPFFFDAGDAGYFSGRDRRFPGRIWRRDGTALDVQAVHKNVADYFDALASAGFTSLPTIRELHATPAIVDVDAKFFAPLGETPLHLAFKITR